MRAAQEPRPARLRTAPEQGHGAPLHDSPLATMLAGAAPVQRLSRLGAMLNAGRPLAPPRRAPMMGMTAVVQRLHDGEREITADDVAAENSVATLQRWGELAEADWNDLEIRAPIAARIAALQAANAQQQAAAAAAAAAAQQQAAAALAQQAAQQAMLAANVPAANFDYPTYQTLVARNLRMDQRAAFFIAGGANAAAICTAIDNAGQSDAARKKALIAFGNGANQAVATRIAGVFDTVMAWRKENIDIDLLEALVEEGVLGFHENRYRDDAIEAGATYVFSFVNLAERVHPEWHVHLGAHDTVKSGSWKGREGRYAGGAAAHVWTDEATNRRLFALVS